MAGGGTTGGHHLLHFNLLERHLLNRLIGRMNRPTVLARMVIAVWLLLEELGFYNLIRKIYANGDSMVEVIFDETASCLNCMDPINTVQPIGNDDLPFLAQILDINEPPMNRRFFYFNRDFFLNRVNHIMTTVCAVIFDESTTSNQVEDHPVIWGFSEGSSSSNQTLIHSSSSSSSSSSTLNPFARQFILGEQSSISPDQRSMFLTFSNGYPLSCEEIIDFFTLNWGPVVEDVMMESTSDDNNPPQYGRIVFTNPSVIRSILNGQSKAKFVVNRKHLWARVFVPRMRN